MLGRKVIRPQPSTDCLYEHPNIYYNSSEQDGLLTSASSR